jgi:hypothetical protein
MWSTLNSLKRDLGELVTQVKEDALYAAEAMDLLHVVSKEHAQQNTASVAIASTVIMTLLTTKLLTIITCYLNV